MGFFSKFKKSKTKSEPNGFEALLAIPYGYDGYEICFVPGKTDPHIYQEISLLISNSRYDLNQLKAYHDLNSQTSEDEFWEFYESWIADLKQQAFMTYLDDSVPMQEFAAAMIAMLNANGYASSISKESLLAQYEDTVAGLGLERTTKYAILEANIAAGELRKQNLELITFFNGVDNTAFAMIPVLSIEKMKELERELKEPYITL